MKKYILSLVIALLLVSGSVAHAAFQTSADRRPGLATEKHLVVRDLDSMRVYEVSDNPQTSDEKAIYVAWLEAQVWDLQKQLNGISVSSECEQTDEDARVKTISDRIAQISAQIHRVFGR